MQQIAEILEQAYAIGTRHGQDLLPQERAISQPDAAGGKVKDFVAWARSAVSGLISHVQQALDNVLHRDQLPSFITADASDTQEVVDQMMDHLGEITPDQIAGWEITSAVEGAVFDTLQAAGVPEIQSVSEGDDRVCPTCKANADQGPITLGSTFQSGDAKPPYHGGCRCNIVTA